MKNLIEQYENLEAQGLYNKGVYLVANAIGLKMQVLSSEYKKHFADDVQKRYVFKIRLSKGGKQYTFEFGQSIAEGSNEPTMYDVLACLTKHDPETFEDFCDNYGYDNDSRAAEKTYKAVCKEFKNMQRLFTEEELELLTIIQ
jgi:hypothetical protein